MDGGKSGKAGVEWNGMNRCSEQAEDCRRGIKTRMECIREYNGDRCLGGEGKKETLDEITGSSQHGGRYTLAYCEATTQPVHMVDSGRSKGGGMR